MDERSSPMIGFLHTSPVHVPTFTELVARIGVGSGVTTHHAVDEEMLAEARRTSPEAVSAQVAAHVFELRAAGCDVVVCTCSTLSPAASALSQPGRPVLAIDAPMAREAVELGPRIGLVVAVESTLGPSASMLEKEAGRQGRPIELVLAPCLEAWLLFESGDLTAYHQAIAGHIDRIDPASVDVIVIGQASMAPAAELVTTDVPVLTSPHLVVDAALSAL